MSLFVSKLDRVFDRKKNNGKITFESENTDIKDSFDEEV